MEEKIVSINILRYNKDDSNFHTLLNLFTGFPYMYYHNGTGNILEEIIEQGNFYVELQKLCLNVNEYCQTYLAYVIIPTHSNEFVAFEQNSESIQNIIPLEKCKYLALDFLLPYFDELYYRAFKKQFDYNGIDNKDEAIRKIYQDIITNIKKEISKDTVINYIRDKITNESELNKDNIKYCLSLLEDILKEL